MKEIRRKNIKNKMNYYSRKKTMVHSISPIQILHGGILETIPLQKSIFDKKHIPANGVTGAKAGEITLLRDGDGVLFPPVQAWRQAGSLP